MLADNIWGASEAFHHLMNEEQPLPNWVERFLENGLFNNHTRFSHTLISHDTFYPKPIFSLPSLEHQNPSIGDIPIIIGSLSGLILTAAMAYWIIKHADSKSKREFTKAENERIVAENYDKMVDFITGLSPKEIEKLKFVLIKFIPNMPNFLTPSKSETTFKGLGGKVKIKNDD